jgi:hypothetical protein
VLLSNWKLSEPFLLGSEGTFAPAGSGDLYLRCRDEWGKLDDNSGRVSVKLSYVGPAKSVGGEVFTPSATAAAEFRTWKDSSGAFQIEAQLVEAKEGAVKLRRKDGKIVSVPLEKLSDADRKFLESQKKPE